MKTNKWIYTAVLGLMFASCQSVETPMFSDAEDAFVAFSAKTINIEENLGKEVKIPVSMVASKSYDATVTFTIDASAYTESGTAAKAGVNYIVKNTTNTLTFTDGGDLTQYIVIEPLDNSVFNEKGNMQFDITLSIDESSSLNLGANYVTTVVLVDDDHPLKAAGILGNYKGSGTSMFDGETIVTWECEITSDPGNVNGVWISQLSEDVSGASFKPIYGKVSADKNMISISNGQDVGTYGSYSLVLDLDDADAVNAVRNGNTITLNAFVGYAAYDANKTLAGYICAVAPVTLTKIGE